MNGRRPMSCSTRKQMGSGCSGSITAGTLMKAFSRKSTNSMQNTTVKHEKKRKKCSPMPPTTKMKTLSSEDYEIALHEEDGDLFITFPDDGVFQTFQVSRNLIGNLLGFDRPEGPTGLYLTQQDPSILDDIRGEYYYHFDTEMPSDEVDRVMEVMEDAGDPESYRRTEGGLLIDFGEMVHLVPSPVDIEPISLNTVRDFLLDQDDSLTYAGIKDHVAAAAYLYAEKNVGVSEELIRRLFRALEMMRIDKKGVVLGFLGEMGAANYEIVIDEDSVTLELENCSLTVGEEDEYVH